MIRLRLVWPVVATALLAYSVAHADESDPRVIEQRLVALESRPEQKSLVAEPVAQARKALERVKYAQAAGDVPHALELATLAKEHTDLAADVLRAVALEKELSAVELKLTDASQKRRRAESLLEESIAHRERTKQELLQLRAAKSVPEKGATPPPVAAPSGKVTKAASSTKPAKTAAPSTVRNPANAPKAVAK